MVAPFRKTLLNESKVVPSGIWTMVNDCREGKQTGALRLAANGEKSLYLLFKRGDVINSYAVSSQKWESLSSDARGAWINSAGGVYAKFIPLSAKGLLLCKLLIQNPNENAQSVVSPAEIGGYLESQSKNPAASLVQIEGEDAVGVILFPGTSGVPYSIFVSSNSTSDQNGIAAGIQNLGRQKCSVTISKFDPTVEAWQEYVLRQVFSDVCEYLLLRLQTLTGRAVVDSLIRLTIVFASRNNLDIGIAERKVVDGEIFPSPRHAAESYCYLLTDMLTHFSGITGSRLLSAALREVVASLPDSERSIIQSFSLFTEGYIYERRS